MILSVVSILLGLTSASVAAESNTRAHIDSEFTAFFQRTNGWVAGDGAISVPLSGNRVLWLFGDSHVDDLDPKTGTMACLFQTRNAGMLQFGADLKNPTTLKGQGPGFRSWLKNGSSDDQWFWPICGFQLHDTVFIYLAALRKTGAGGLWGFESAGRDFWAKAKLPDLMDIEFVRLPDFAGIGFGQGFLKEGNYMYAFGSKQKGLGSDVFVARFSARTPEGTWSFWDGRRWTNSAANAKAITRASSTSVHVCQIRKQFVLTTSAWSIACDQGKKIYTSTSREPTGPFTPLKEVYQIPDTYQGHAPFFYFPILHPEFINKQNEVLLTYSINNYEPCVSGCIDGRAIPDHYRPKAIRVPLDLILPAR